MKIFIRQGDPKEADLDLEDFPFWIFCSNDGGRRNWGISGVEATVEYGKSLEFRHYI